MTRAGGPFDCLQQLGPLTPSTLGTEVVLLGLAPSQVCVAAASELSFGVAGRHEGDALRADWGGVLPAGAIRWEIGQDLSSYSFLSFRVGQEFDFAFDDALSIDVELEVPGPAGPTTVAVTVEPLVHQDRAPDVNGALQPSDFMHTVRIPLTAFCEQVPIDLDPVDALLIRFPSGAPNGSTLLIDSIEFTRNAEFDDSEGLCQP